MLLQFRVENHRSLRDEQQLSMAAATLGHDDPRLLRTDALTEPLLPAVAIYGANASGKSNVLNALWFMRHAVLLSYRRWEPGGGIPNEPFALSEKRTGPSLYEVEIICDGIRFRYGFVVTRARIEEEWLYAWPRGKKQTWFEREGDNITFGENMRGGNSLIRELTRDNSLFLSVAAQNNHTAVLPVFRWFRETEVTAPRGRAVSPGLTITREFSRQLSLFDEDDGFSSRGMLVELLRAADTGIVDLRIDESDADISGFRQRRLEFKHKSEADEEGGAWLPLHAESAGTVALVNLGPRLSRALRHGRLICIDEIEASLHPMLSLAILNLFQDPQRNPRHAQLLFTTHDTTLLGTILGEPPLRRDQVWFTEKEPSGATHLYPLTDFHPRKQENLERGYLQGRYGAIPFLGNLLAYETSTGEGSE